MPTEPTQPFPTAEDTCDAFATHVNAGKVRTYDALGARLVMGAREGARFQDAFTGSWYWNCHCNGGVFNLGHRNPEVVAAVRSALDSLDIGNHHLVSGFRAEAARRLAETTGDLLPGVVWGVSGGEANDLALKLARGFTGRDGVVSAHGGYHGHTGLSLATGDAQFREPFGPSLPGFAQVPYDDLPAMDAAVGDGTAAVILESIPATSGFPIPSSGYLAGVREICTERGALLLLDEVQTGLGRTGSAWYYRQEGVEPDAVTTGKGLSGGVYPITATLLRPELKDYMDDRPFSHVSTFGGSELGCVAAATVVGMVSDPAFLGRVRALGARFEEGFTGLPFTLRRRGLAMGLAFGQEGDGVDAFRRLFDAGVFTLFAGNDTSVLQFLPPLVLSDDEADEIVGIVRKTFG